MASDITTASDFTTPNMKPASGEIMDSVWGHKISENTGYLYYKYPQQLASWTMTDHSDSASVAQEPNGTIWFVKTPHSTMTGTVFGTSSANDTSTYDVQVNGVSIVSESWSANSFTVSVNYDISSLTDGVWYPITWQASAFQLNSRYRSVSNSLWGTTT